MQPSPPPAPRARLLHDLGIVGWGEREPILVAALATEEPLLLIGPHGCAKSLLLERLALALDLSFRHYNASTVNFDDLVGFPVPDGNRVKYLRTPLDAWDAEAIFLDEINRCRPDMQNRLFPLIHERRLQGQTLDRLRFRWSAMNPPGGEDEGGYLGTEALDVALADRFAFVVDVPPVAPGPDRLALILGPKPVDGGGARLREAVEQTRGALRTTASIHGECFARYVEAVADALSTGGVELSGRRLRFLHQSVVAVVATGRIPSQRDAALCALLWSLPHRACGELDAALVITAHNAAWRYLDAPVDSARRRLLGERDPLRRIVLALSSDDELVTATVLDARAGLPPAQRLALSVQLFPLLVRLRPALPGSVFEALGGDLARVNQVQEHQRAVATWDAKYALAGDIARAAAGLGRGEEWIAQVLWAAYAADEPITVGADVAFAQALAAAIEPLRRAA